MKPLDERTSAAMARVRQKRTKPENVVAAALRKLGVRYRRNVPSLPGKPDFANVRRGWAINVHGCFWHQHSCKRGTKPKHNSDFWERKFNANKGRDVAVDGALRDAGLCTLTVWECETRDTAELETRLSKFLSAAVVAQSTTRQ